MSIAVIAAQLGLLESETVFVAEYVGHLNRTRAYKAAHPDCQDVTARTEGSRTLAKPNVQAAIQQLRALQLARLELNADDVLKKLFAIAMADPRELVSVVRGACRHCHGEGHLHQFTDGEFDAEQAKADKLGEPFDPKGGSGYSFALPPVESCTQCAGTGDSRVVMADTSTVSPQAAALYAGAKIGKSGMEVLTHDQLAAMEKLAKHLGMYAADNKQKGAGLGEWLAQMGASGRSMLPVVQDPEAE